MNRYGTALRDFADVPNQAGYQLTVHDRCGAKYKAQVVRADDGTHFLAIQGERIKLQNYLGWEALPVQP